MLRNSNRISLVILLISLIGSNSFAGPNKPNTLGGASGKGEPKSDSDSTPKPVKSVSTAEKAPKPDRGVESAPKPDRGGTSSDVRHLVKVG